jgi:DNA-binding SARP family transcriptional activator
VINFKVLGKVAAWEDDWEAGLGEQLQRMLARLIMQKGEPVSEAQLKYALGWEKVPERGLKGVANDLRRALTPAMASKALVSTRGGAYQLALDPDQADVLRFRARVSAADPTSGADRVQCLRRALAEWGPDAHGLYGGLPLRDLDGAWAKRTRDALRGEYRDALLECVRHDMHCGRYQLVMQECGQLIADDPDAQGDSEFIEVRILSIYWSGDPVRAIRIFEEAENYARSFLKKELSMPLRRRAEQMRHEDPQLDALKRLPDSSYTLVPVVPNLPAVAMAPASAIPSQVHGIPQPVSNERTPVSEPSITFNIGGTASVGSAIARNDGHVTINVGAATDPVVGVADGSEPDDEDREDS